MDTVEAAAFVTNEKTCAVFGFTIAVITKSYTHAVSTDLVNKIGTSRHG